MLMLTDLEATHSSKPGQKATGLQTEKSVSSNLPTSQAPYVNNKKGTDSSLVQLVSRKSCPNTERKA